MRRLAAACSILGSLIAAGCTQPVGEPTDQPAGEAQDSISWGTADGTAHPAVVALLTSAGGGSFEECSGTIVQQSGGFGYVLTAAHCCQKAPQIVTTKNDYDAQGASAVNALFGGPLPANVYKVDATSVYYHSQYSINNLDAGHDFCMLKFATTNTLSVIGLPTNNDGLTTNMNLEHVGFGTTNTSPNNTVRNKGTGQINGLTPALIYYNQGGSQANHTPGTCQGDSGGPALIVAGQAQSQQKVVGVTSFGGADAQGNAIPCGNSDVGGAGRVSGEIGPGKFITQYLSGVPTGLQPGQLSCNACQQDTLSGGACTSTYNACANNSLCNTLLNCLGGCTTATCSNNCWNAAGATGQNLYNNIIGCICNTGCQSECAGDPLCAQPTCGLQSADANCDMCLQNKCCSQASACANNSTCLTCVTSANPPASCNTNTLANSFISCLSNNCATACGISTSSSSSSSSSGSTSSSSSSSSGSASSSSGSASSSASSSGSTNTGGAGTGGAGPTGGAAPTGGAGPTGGAPAGTGAGSSNGNDPDQDGGCNVAPAGTGSDTGSNGSLAALLLGAAIAFVRRRKAA